MATKQQTLPPVCGCGGVTHQGGTGIEVLEGNQMGGGVDQNYCARAQAQCRKEVESAMSAAIEQRLGPISAQLARIEAHSENTAQQLENLADLADRVVDLEKWKAGLNGHARAVAEFGAQRPDMESLRKHISNAASEAVRGALEVHLKTRRSDSLPSWVPQLLKYAAAPSLLLLAIIIVLAMYAGPAAKKDLPLPTTSRPPVVQSNGH